MIDFIKFELVNSSVKQLETNPFLEFKTLVNTETAELSRFKNAFYKGLKFTIIEPTEKYPNCRITVEGSLHKFWNNGRHNFNDFKIEDILTVLKELEDKFNIKPENCVLKQLELGVNIAPPYDTKTILRSCIMHKTTRFKSVFVKDEGEYIQAWHQRYIVKIYDKRKHYEKRGYKINCELLRFEIKYTRMHLWHEMDVYTLRDLIVLPIHLFKLRLTLEWRNVLFYDFKVFDGTEFEHIFSNKKYWEQLNPNRFKYQRNKLKNKCKEDRNNIKDYIEKLIEEKAEFLCPTIPCFISI